MGERLWEGTEGEVQDQVRALGIFRQVSMAGHPGAQFMLAHAIMHGMPGTEKDTPQDGFDLAQNAARAGFPPAQELMSGMMQCVVGFSAFLILFGCCGGCCCGCYLCCCCRCFVVASWGRGSLGTECPSDRPVTLTPPVTAAAAATTTTTRYLASVRATGGIGPGQGGVGHDKCAQCGVVPEGGPSALKICSGCKMIWYCSKECQVRAHACACVCARVYACVVCLCLCACVHVCMCEGGGRGSSKTRVIALSDIVTTTPVFERPRRLRTTRHGVHPPS